MPETDTDKAYPSERSLAVSKREVIRSPRGDSREYIVQVDDLNVMVRENQPDVPLAGARAKKCYVRDAAEDCTHIAGQADDPRCVHTGILHEASRYADTVDILQVFASRILSLVHYIKKRPRTMIGGMQGRSAFSCLRVTPRRRHWK